MAIEVCYGRKRQVVVAMVARELVAGVERACSRVGNGIVVGGIDLRMVMVVLGRSETAGRDGVWGRREDVGCAPGVPRCAFVVVYVVESVVGHDELRWALHREQHTSLKAIGK